MHKKKLPSTLYIMRADARIDLILNLRSGGWSSSNLRISTHFTANVWPTWKICACMLWWSHDFPTVPNAAKKYGSAYFHANPSHLIQVNSLGFEI